MCHAVVLVTVAAVTAPGVDNNWRNVAIGGGGYVTAVVCHPTQTNLVYARTDVGGCYRFDAAQQAWVPLLEMITRQQANLFSIESIALDARDPDRVYIACGDYLYNPASQNDVLKSTNCGTSWVSTGLRVRMGGNESYRNAGERLAVDPQDGRVLYFGSRADGLWCSTNAATWHRVTAFSTNGITSPAGIPFVVFDATSGTVGSRTRVLYAGAAGRGVLCSTNAGATWYLLAGGPATTMIPQRAAVATNGALHVTFRTSDLSNGSVWKYDTTGWHDITPVTAQGYCALAVDPRNPAHVITAQLVDDFYNVIYRTTNAGASWSAVRYTAQADVPWWPDFFWSAATASLAIDPFDSRHVWYSDWYGMWRTDAIGAPTSRWYTCETGHEEVVTLALHCPSAGPGLLSGAADVDGFRHDPLSDYPLTRYAGPMAQLGDTTGLDSCPAQPLFVVRCGGQRWNTSYNKCAGYSSDGGASWSAFSGQPFAGARNGRIAVAASNTANIVWLPQGVAPYYTTNRGVTWSAASGATTSPISDVWNRRQVLAADKVLPATFYFWKGTRLYRSDNGGATWAQVNAAMPSSTASYGIKAMPGAAGEVWIGADDIGLYVSTNTGVSFTKVSTVSKALLFAFGAGPGPAAAPTLYIFGKPTTGAEGVYQSLDRGATWMQMSTQTCAMGCGPCVMEADRQAFGRVYVGTSGRGIYYSNVVPEAGFLALGVTTALGAWRCGRPPAQD